MSLEEELTINQFGQGVYSADDLLDQFSQLDKNQKRGRFFDLNCEVWDLNLVESDVEQVLVECSFTKTDALYKYLNLSTLTTSKKGMVWISETGNPPEGTLDKPYKVLLHLFKIGYQRRYDLEKENPTNWRYWDLANNEIAQGILTKHYGLVEEIYNTPGFRSEFVSLAKLWHEQNNLEKIRFKEPDPDSPAQTHFDFVTYDDIVADSIDKLDNKHRLSMLLLREALQKALEKRYGLDNEQANRIILAVIDRHMQETYNSSLFRKYED